jgi:chromosome segregation ATPase
MIIRKTVLTGLALLLAWSVLLPATLTAASLSAARQKKLEAIMTAAGSPLTQEINKLYKQVLTLQTTEQNAADHAQKLKYNNETALHQVRQLMKKIDEAKISKLDTKLTQTKDNYEPLFALHRTLNQKGKEAQLMKAAVELARLDIRRQTNELKLAKASRTKTLKQIRETLATIRPIETKLKTQKSEASARKKKFTAEWSTFGEAITKGDPKLVKTSLTNLVAHMNELVKIRQKTASLEADIGAVIKKANSQIPR